MSKFDQYPLQVRKKIAVSITVSIALLLLIILLIVYIGPKDKTEKKGSTNAWAEFYATLIQNTQSYFSNKPGTINK